jgi:hypothetical protein
MHTHVNDDRTSTIVMEVAATADPASALRRRTRRQHRAENIGTFYGFRSFNVNARCPHAAFDAACKIMRINMRTHIFGERNLAAALTRNKLRPKLSIR